MAVCELDSCNRRHATFQLEKFAEALGGWDFRFGAAMKWSGGAYGTFLKIFKGIPAYRSYVNPYFKVSVGDFRTKAEAMEKLIHIKRVFPAAFIVKEKIRFPHVDRATLEDLPDSLEVFKL